MLKRLFLTVLAAVGFFLESANAVIRDGGIDPSNLSRGSWIYIMPDAMDQLGGNVSSVTNLSSLMTYMKNQGLQYIIIKGAQADTVFTVSGATNFTPAVVNAGHAAGLKVFGYIYTTGANVPGEIAMADFIFQQGADGLIYDAEIEWETVGGSASVRSNLAIQLCSTVRTNWPNKFMGLSTWPYRASHPNLPYKEFAYYCDVIMPQVYWIEIGTTPSGAVATMNSQWNSWKSGLTGIWTNAIKPFVGTGQGWNSTSNVTAAQIWEFENALRTNANPVSPGGYKNVDYWRAELHPPAIWAAIRTNFLGRPYTNAPTIEYAPTNSTVDSTSAVIVWPTDQISDGVVEYGVTTSYGTSVTNSTLQWYHNVTLTGLSPDTSYHYRVKSKGTNNLIGISGDYIFTTPGSSYSDVIVESRLAGGALNSNPPYVDTGFGNSTLKSSAGGLTGTGSRYTETSSRTFTITPTLPAAGGVYDVFMTHGTATSISDDIVVTVSKTGCTGLPTTTTIFREPNGDTWELLGRMTNNVGVTVPTLTFTHSGGTVAAGSRMYSDSIKFVYIPPPPTSPSISAPPQNFTTNQGGSATFSVSATGTALLTYQWKFNGVNISGATQSSYTRTNLQTSDAGSYSVGITNAIGYSNSPNAILTVINAPPGITTQPQSLTVTQGNNATFTIAATESPSYQWKFNGGNIAGATASSYTKTNAQAGDAGSYSVALTNGLGSTNSANAILAVRIPPGISAQPQSLVVTQGNIATFTVTASGDATLGYIWRRNGTPISGATQSAYTINPSQTSDAGTYSVVITNGVGSLTSSNALLTVLAAPGISTQPQSLVVTQGNNATFTVSGSGNPLPGYQWRFNGGNIAGATASSYTKTNAQSGNAGTYSVVLTNTVGTSNSLDAILTVRTPPSISIQPQSLVATQGNSATFTVTAAGDAMLGYQWRFNGTNISGATDSGYTQSNVQTSNTGSFSVVVTNGVGSITSSIATLAVLFAPIILVEPQDVVVTEGSNATFTVSASGNPVPGYQWRFNGTNISGATANSYTKTNAQPGDAGSYSVVITNSVGTTNSADSILTIANPPIITQHPQNVYARTGGVATLTVTASGDPPLSYQWRFNGGNIVNATDTNYSKANLQLSDAGTYSVIVSNVGGTTASADALVSVTPITPANIDSIFITPDKKIHLIISGELGNFEIQQATNITQWESLVTLLATNSPFEFIDGETNHYLRYYRAKTLP